MSLIHEDLRAYLRRWLLLAPIACVAGVGGFAQERKRSDPPVIVSSWDDLLAGVRDAEDWGERKETIRQRYLDLIRDEFKPEKPALDLRVHETVVVDGVYARKLVSYQVETDERAQAYLGVPLRRDGWRSSGGPVRVCFATDRCGRSEIVRGQPNALRPQAPLHAD